MNYYTVTVKHGENVLLRTYVLAFSKQEAIDRLKTMFEEAEYFAIAEGKG